MSSTRRAKDDSIFHQIGYASAPEYERGLIGSMVAKRCALLDDPADRELIWFIHQISQQRGGLKNLAESLVAEAGDQIGTSAMVQIGKTSGDYNASEVKAVRRELPQKSRHKFPLKGEVGDEITGDKLASRARFTRNLKMVTASGSLADYQKFTSEEREAAKHHPESYPVAVFLALCRKAALNPEDGTNSTPGQLENFLQELAINPGRAMHSDLPWYFSGLDIALQNHLHQFKAQAAAGVVVTGLGREVYQMLDRTLKSGSMSLLEGNARTGKSFSAQAWCKQHPGQARYIEIPVGNDDTSFYRAFARGLGLGNFTQAKAIQLRERVEAVLLTGDLMLVLDEAHRLWPQRNSRYGFPARITWVMSMANQGARFCLISTPQFLQQQKMLEREGWNSAQFIGRLRRYKQLPLTLSEADLQAVAKMVLPEADARTLKAIALYAARSCRYLAAIESIADDARFLAGEDGRQQVTAADVATAMKQTVIPSDASLVEAMKGTEKPSKARRQPAVEAMPEDPASDLDEPAPTTPRRREVAPPEVSEPVFALRQVKPEEMANC